VRISRGEKQPSDKFPGSGFAFEALDLTRPTPAPAEINQCPRDVVALSRAEAAEHGRPHLYRYAKPSSERILDFTRGGKA
jgi:hypothetical protein